MSENVLPIFFLGFLWCHFEFIFIMVWERCERVIWLHSFICSCPAFPTWLAEETVFPPLESFLLCRKLTIGVWVYFWALCYPCIFLCWYHTISIIEALYCCLGQTPGDGEEQGGLACCSLWGCKELDTTWQWTTIVWNLGGLCCLLCSFPSRLLWQFWVFHGSM